jgi:SAM-dependent methyltransferase
MNINLYNKFLASHFILKNEINHCGEITDGILCNKLTGDEFIIKNGIPRFTNDCYSDSFGFQWSLFKDLQIDSKNGFNYSEERIKKYTKWNLSDLKGKYVLECGSGPGRFSEVFLKYGAILVSVDMSIAIDVNRNNQNVHPNHLLLQADITELNYFIGKFDYVFCYGVLQHTPNPLNTLKALLAYGKVDFSSISCDVYERSYIPRSWSFPKYFIRPFIKKISKERLLNFIKWYVPLYLPFDTFIKRNIWGGHYIASFIPIPIYNYIDHKYSKEERIQHAIMDTFDALSPVYDIPLNRKMINKYFSKNFPSLNFDIENGANGLVINLNICGE